MVGRAPAPRVGRVCQLTYTYLPNLSSKQQTGNKHFLPRDVHRWLLTAAVAIRRMRVAAALRIRWSPEGRAGASPEGRGVYTYIERSERIWLVVKWGEERTFFF